MIHTIRMIYAIFDRRTRLQLAGLFGLMLVAAVLEMLGIGMIIPVIHALTSPESLAHLPVVGSYFATPELARFESAVLVTLAGLLFVFVIKNALLGIVIHLTNHFVQMKSAFYRARLLAVYCRMPYSLHLSRNSAELVHNIVISVPAIFNGMVLPFLRMLLEIVLSLAAVAALVLIEPMGTATVIGSLAALSSLIYLWLRGRMTSWGKKIVNISQSVVLWINQTLGSIKVNKVLGREAFFEKRCADLAFEHGRYNALALTFGQIPRLAIEVIGVAVLAALIAYHAATGASAADILPTVGVFAVAAMRLIPAFNRIVGGAIGIRHERAALDHIHGDLISFRELDRMGSSHEPPLAFRTELRFDRVRYIYPDRSVSALADVSFSIRQGETVGIVGATGSGKTTLADILLGILPPTEGRLLVEGIDIASCPAAWRRNLGYVPQDIYLIDDSLRNNIALGIAESDIDPVRLAAVVKLARLESLIKSLPQGLDTRVGERGANLSGGQRQRVGIARALYGDPQVLVFDEATSALDNESERQIIETIEGLKGEKTIIIIAHRLSTVRHCDKLMFMKEGRIADTGPFDDLHRRNPDFRRLVELGELRPESAPLPTAVS